MLETRQALSLLVSILLGCAAGEPSARAPQAGPSGPTGSTWVGGFAIPTEPEEGRFVEIDFDEAKVRFDPAKLEPAAPVKTTVRRDRQIRVELPARTGGPFVLEATLDRPGVLEGIARHGAASGPFLLTAVRSYDRDSARLFEGTYAAADGTLLRVVAGAAGLTVYDTGDGRVRRIHATGPDTFLVGPSIAGTFPWTGEVHFSLTDGGLPRALHWRDDDGRTRDAERVDIRSEPVRFTSADGTALAGVVYLPPGPGPFPAAVAVHGSGAESREWIWGQTMSRVLLSEGFAVLLYDKRGVGLSGGDYVPGFRETDNTSPENLERLAADARAALGALRSRPDVDPKRVGMFGVSQAGWILPLAAAKSPDTRFLLIVSGPTVHTSLEALHSELLADGEKPTDTTLEQADALVQKAPRSGFDPAPYIRRLDIPALWIFGEIDTSIPVPESLRVLASIRRERAHDFEVATFPRAGHGLYEVPRDLRSEVWFSRGLAPGYLSTARAWLRARAQR
jgi:hypothetical protein